MMRYIYAMPLGAIILLMLALLLIWVIISQYFGKKGWAILNTVMAGLAASVILYATIFTRRPGDYAVILTPFAALAAARQQPELYREMLMNVFLFFPLGLTLSNALPRRWHRWGRIVLTTLAGFLFSAGIEVHPVPLRPRHGGGG